FNFWLTCKSAYTACVDFATVPGTATANVDYVSSFGTVCFPPGVTNAQVIVSVLGDLECETNEFFGLQLSNPVGVLLSPNQARATILDDDCIFVRFSPTTNSANEG